MQGRRIEITPPSSVKGFIVFYLKLMIRSPNLNPPPTGRRLLRKVKSRGEWGHTKVSMGPVRLKLSPFEVFRGSLFHRNCPPYFLVNFPSRSCQGVGGHLQGILADRIGHHPKFSGFFVRPEFSGDKFPVGEVKGKS